MQKFNWVSFWLLGVLTCGIYTIIVWYNMDKNTREMSERVGTEKNDWSYMIFSFLLGMVTFGITGIIWMYKHFKAQEEIANRVGVQLMPSSNPWIMLLIAFVPVYSFIAICDNHNKLVDAVA